METEFQFKQIGKFIEQECIVDKKMAEFDMRDCFMESFQYSLFFFDKYKTPLNICCHSVMVSLATLLLIYFSGNRENLLNHIKRNSENYQILNISDAMKSLIRAAMLHDIGKIDEINSRKQGKIVLHAIQGGQILRSHDLLWEAEICEKHTTDDFKSTLLNESSKLVNCADKLVNHHQLVSLEERFVYLQKVYKINEIVKQDYQNYLAEFDVPEMYSEFKVVNQKLQPFYRALLSA